MNSKQKIKELAIYLNWAFQQYASDRAMPDIKFIEETIERHLEHRPETVATIEEILEKWFMRLKRKEVRGAREFAASVCYEVVDKLAIDLDESNQLYLNALANQKALQARLDSELNFRHRESASIILELQKQIKTLTDSGANITNLGCISKPETQYRDLGLPTKISVLKRIARKFQKWGQGE